MSLRLSPEDEREYGCRSAVIDIEFKHAKATGDKVMEKKCRQRKSHLYEEFKARELPPEPTFIDYEYENGLSIEDRIDRIEQHLKIGRYAE